MSASLTRLVHAKVARQTQKEKLLQIAKLAKETADVCFSAGDDLGGRSLLDIADYARRKAEAIE